ncbi:MAG: DUF5340 domain-containing protein [Cyanobacteria bacterium P01_H01_bin.15]
MNEIPLPAHVHYEILLQMLEQKTLPATSQQPALREQARELIISLRKAFSQQKHFESFCSQTGQDFDYRWSLSTDQPTATSHQEA